MKSQIIQSISCHWPTYLLTIDLVSLEIGCRSLKKMPVSPLVVRDISFHLVLNNFIWQEQPFYSGNLRTWETQSGRRKKITENKKRGRKLNYLNLSKVEGLVQEEETSESDSFSDREHYFGPSVGLRTLQTTYGTALRYFFAFYLCAANTRVRMCAAQRKNDRLGSSRWPSRRCWIFFAAWNVCEVTELWA